MKYRPTKRGAFAVIVIAALFILMGLIEARPASANWRNYINTDVCRGDQNCAREQDFSRRALDSGSIDDDIVRKCRQSFADSSYLKKRDYAAAFQCANGAQSIRNERIQQQATTDALNRLGKNNYRRYRR